MQKVASYSSEGGHTGRGEDQGTAARDPKRTKEEKGSRPHTRKTDKGGGGRDKQAHTSAYERGMGPHSGVGQGGHGRAAREERKPECTPRKAGDAESNHRSRVAAVRSRHTQ